jgi:hypothetical protein
MDQSGRIIAAGEADKHSIAASKHLPIIDGFDDFIFKLIHNRGSIIAVLR